MKCLWLVERLMWSWARSYKDLHKIRIHMSLGCTARPAQIATAQGKLEKRATEGRRYWLPCIQQLKVSGNFVLYLYDLCLFTSLNTFCKWLGGSHTKAIYFICGEKHFWAWKMKWWTQFRLRKRWNEIPNSSWPILLTISSKGKPSHSVISLGGILGFLNGEIQFSLSEWRINELRQIPWRNDITRDGTRRSSWCLRMIGTYQSVFRYQVFEIIGIQPKIPGMRNQTRASSKQYPSWYF